MEEGVMKKKIRASMCQKCYHKQGCGWLDNVGPRKSCEDFKSFAEADELATQVTQLINWVSETNGNPT
jgi:hypothetical protein